MKKIFSLLMKIDYFKVIICIFLFILIIQIKDLNKHLSNIDQSVRYLDSSISSGLIGLEMKK